MNRRWWRFGAAGLGPTVVDVGLFIFLVDAAGWIVAAADLVALLAAALLGFALHHRVTLAQLPSARLRRRPVSFVALALLAALVDLVVVMILVEIAGYSDGFGLISAKLSALAIAFAVRFLGYRTVLFTEVRSDLAHRAPRPLPKSDVTLSLIVPAYREEDRIATTLERIRTELAPLVDGRLEIVVVDDGSADGTVAAAQAAGADRVIALETNRGKGAAVRAGILASTGSVVAFTDADLSYPPAQVAALAARVSEGWDMVVGNRLHSSSATVARASVLRNIGGRAINLVTYLVLLGAHRDTQCGIKAFRGDVARSLFSRTRIDGFAFDIELFHLAESDRLAVAEMPVHVVNEARSTVRALRDGLALIRDVMRILWGARSGLYEGAAEPN